MGNLGKRSVLTIILGFVATLSLTSGSAGAGSFGPPRTDYTYSRNFIAVQERYFDTIQRCIRVTISGKVTFRTKNTVGSGYGTVYTFIDRKVYAPTMKVESYGSCVYGPRQYKSVYKVTMEQNWSSSTCSTGVSIGVGVPWGVSVSASPSCGESKLAHRKTTYEGSTGVRTQYNSTTRVAFGNEGMWEPMAFGSGGYNAVRNPLCFKVDADVVVYPTRLGGSDSWTARIKPCVQWW